MVSLLTAPRPADFRPNIWPANWQLWREDKFNTPGTVYDPTMWFHLNDSDTANIIPCPGGGLRLVADTPSDGGGGFLRRHVQLNSGPQWWRTDNHGRQGTNAQAQIYRPPFIIKAKVRYSSIDIKIPVRFGLWLHNPMVHLRSEWGVIAASVPDDPNLAIELDADERETDWSGHTQGMWSNWWGEPSRIGAAFTKAGTSVGKWYEVAHLVFRDDLGRMRVATYVNSNRRAVFWEELLSPYPPRSELHDLIFDIAPFNVELKCWINPDETKWPPADYDGADVFYYDVREFQVYVPPGDPRLSEPFKSNSPDAPADVPPFWEIAGSITGNTLNVTITDGQPRADWSVSVTEDDPAPSPPVTGSGKIKWIAGTKDHNVPGLDISSLDASKDLKVTVTHGGRRWTVAVKR